MVKRDFLVLTSSGSEYLILTRQEVSRIAVPLVFQLKGGNRRIEDGLAAGLPQVGEKILIFFGDRRFNTSIVKEVREL